MERVTRKRIPLSELRNYIDTSARLGEDISHENGTVLIPKGTEISALVKFTHDIERTLVGWGISAVFIELHSQIDVRLLEKAIKKSVNFINIDTKFAKETVKRVSEVYHRISSGNCGPKDFEKLVSSGKTLTKIAVEAKEIMFCLGHVRNSDEYTYVHSLNVSLLCAYLANKMFPNDREFAECASIGGVMHDLGKAKIPKEILNKPGRLSEEEFTIMKTHSTLGEEIAKGFGITDPRVLAIVRGHHERYCGDGYPDGFSKEDIRIEARIAAVADVFDALTARRVYKEPIEARAAIGIMVEDARLHFDPDVLRALLLSVGTYPPGTLVELSDLSVCMVVGSNGDDLVRPHVLLKIDAYGRQVNEVKIIDLKNSALHVKKSIQSLGKIAF